MIKINTEAFNGRNRVYIFAKLEHMRIKEIMGSAQKCFSAVRNFA